MLTERINLMENRNDAYLDVYARPGLWNQTRPAMLVIPGGGYSCVCSDREGEPIAMLYLAEGFNCFVLNYPCAPYCVSEGGESLPLIVASKAVAHIRRNAKKYGIDPEKIACIGFSAGGHLAGSLATMWHYDFAAKEANIEYGENKTAATVLSYAVISGNPDIWHRGSFVNLLTEGKSEPSPEKCDFYSVEKQVSDKTPPCFIWHTATDGCVPVENSIVMAEALAAKKVPFEMHIYPEGSHGLATCKFDVINGNVPSAVVHAGEWIDASSRWLKNTLKF